MALTSNRNSKRFEEWLKTGNAASCDTKILLKHTINKHFYYIARIVNGQEVNELNRSKGIRYCLCNTQTHQEVGYELEDSLNLHLPKNDDRRNSAEMSKMIANTLYR